MEALDQIIDLKQIIGLQKCYFLLSLPVGASQVAPVEKNLPANAGDTREWVWSLGEEDPQEEGMATHSSIFAWRIPWTEEPGRLQAIGLQKWFSTHMWIPDKCFNSNKKQNSTPRYIWQWAQWCWFSE